MTDIRKNALRLSILGFVLGVLIGAAFPLLSGSWTMDLSMLLHLLVSGALGAVCWGTTVVFSIEEWSILRATVTHCLIAFGSLFAFFAVEIAAGLMKLPPPGVIALILVFWLTAYILIWLIHYLIYRYKVKKMNAKLREWKARRR